MQNSKISTYQGKDVLSTIENSLPKYNKFIVKKFIKYSKFQKEKEFRALDFGAGKGSLALIWEQYTGQNIECLEIDNELRNEMKSRGFTCWDSIAAIKGKYDYIYSSNVLEHIENDEKVLRELSGLLKVNGRIGIYVPAFMILYSELDRSVGHYRRYTKKELVFKVESAGLKIIRSEFIDFLGFFASLVIRIVGWHSAANIGSSKSLKIYDTLIFPASRFFDKLTMGKLLGKNVFLVAEKRTQIE